MKCYNEVEFIDKEKEEEIIAQISTGEVENE
jgi:hypothetical protein